MGNKKLVITLIIIVAILIVALSGAIIYILTDKDNNTNNNKVVNTAKNNDKEEIEVEDEFDDEDLGEKHDSIERQEKETFNATFTAYEGAECTASSVKSLLSTVKYSNSVSDNYVNLNPTGITDTSTLNSSKKYSVELSYADNGYVEEITILEANPLEGGDNVTSESDDMAKAVFNAQFTSYLGKITGVQLNALLSTIQSSNSTNPEHQISLTSNNLQDLNGIDATGKYVITLTYDDNKYISNINIDKDESMDSSINNVLE